LIFPRISPNFHGFPKFLGGSPPTPLSRTPMGVNNRAELVPRLGLTPGKERSEMIAFLC
jgi:hypothetical protein